MKDRNADERPAVEAVLAGGGEMGQLMRSIAWSETPLGPVSGWSQALRTMVGLLLRNRFPLLVWWGPSFVQLYNDAYRPIPGEKHPRSMGQPAGECWAEIWDILRPMIEAPFSGQAATWSDDLFLLLNRKGFLEETHFKVAYSPVPDETVQPTGIGGVLATVAETTAQVFGERQLRTLRELGARAAESKTPGQACEMAAAVFAENPSDIPFALLYMLDAEGHRAHLASSCGFDGESGMANPSLIDLHATPSKMGWPVARVVERGQPEVVADLRERFGSLPSGRWSEPPRCALILPLTAPDKSRPLGVLIAGLSPHRELDEGYRTFFELAAAPIVTAIRNATAFQEERLRAEALAEIDRAKTAFFSNVSHEFRTPLTLMLGPEEDALGSPECVLAGDDLRAVHRNTLRLLKLVNTLLDFSRIEAGRAQASYHPVDLPALTKDIASAFRSAIERGGLAFEVECPPLSESVYVDREMWEKVVLNLLSNAFKFTFDGKIAVALRAAGDHVELEVKDTGIGIPEHALPRVFERFHRIVGARARTHEGSGIGLALVHDLVKLHGGTITVASRVDVGTTFKVSIPLGNDHLPAERIGAIPTLASTSLGAEPFVAEALRWLPTVPVDLPEGGKSELPGRRLPTEEAGVARVLVADDNADMRDYVTRLLRPHWTVEAVSDGAEALARARDERPDLILTDVMMPRLDGFGLLRALREDPRTASVPVVMLSARAGEESRVDGLRAGADDYLVKPFSGKELLTRVGTHLELGRLRRRAELEREKLDRFLMAAPFAIVWLDGPTHRVVLSNPKHREFIGGKNITGMTVIEGLPELLGQPIMQVLDRVYETGEPFSSPRMLIPLERGGRVVDCWFEVVYEALRNERGDVEGILGCGIDVTTDVLARREIDSARQSAEAANRAKDEFLAMLGHELRNPLSPILTAVQLMRMRGREAGEVAVIERQVGHLVRLVDDLLDISRITRGKVELRKERLELASIIVRAVEMASPLLEQRQQRLDLRVPPDGLLVEGDPARLAQVVSNLLTNAAKYSESGTTIHIVAGRAGQWVRLRIRDEGAGIAPDMLHRIFDLFVQQPQSLDRSKGGLGLGLAIVQNLVEIHGGHVSAESEGLGRGSEFTVDLPLAPGAEEFEEPRPAQLISLAGDRGPEPSNNRILVVDDNLDAAEMIAEVLRELGYEIQVAFDGPSALKVVEAFRPNVCLIDIGLPVMDGYELSRRLRESGHLAENARIVAITGYGQDVDRRRSNDAGFNAHLVKPVSLEVLARAVLN